MRKNKLSLLLSLVTLICFTSCQGNAQSSYQIINYDNRSTELENQNFFIEVDTSKFKLSNEAPKPFYMLFEDNNSKDILGVGIYKPRKVVSFEFKGSVDESNSNVQTNSNIITTDAKDMLTTLHDRSKSMLPNVVEDSLSLSQEGLFSYLCIYNSESKSYTNKLMQIILNPNDNSKGLMLVLTLNGDSKMTFREFSISRAKLVKRIEFE